MRRISLLLSLGLLSLTACGPGGAGPGSGGDSSEYSSLEVSLTGVDPEGDLYRLRNAEFEIVSYTRYGDAGATRRVVSSEDDPDAEFIHVRLLPANYTVELLNDDWYLERREGSSGQFETVDDAILLSNRQQYVYLYDNSTRTIYYRFGVDGDLIDFRHGDLNIGIQIEKPDEDGGRPPYPPADAGVGGNDAGSIAWGG